MNDLDFIEIGTSDFKTLIQKCKNDAKGISIEPIKRYLDRLPNKPNVKKINCAVSFDDTESMTEIYYISEENIQKHNLSPKLKGCNSIGSYHLQHIEKNLTHLVSIDKIQQIPISKILIDNNVRKINFLKIDTEGADCYILMSLLRYLKTKPIEFWPRKIQFESNRLSSDELIVSTINAYQSIGYSIEKQKNDTILTLEQK